MPIADKLNVLALVRKIVVPLVGPSCGKLTSVPAPTVAGWSDRTNRQWFCVRDDLRAMFAALRPVASQQRGW